jgi:hypothetical protein
VRLRGSVTPIVLVALALGAAVYAYLVDRDRVSDADREARRGHVFVQLRTEDVRRMRLEHGGEALVLERGGDADGGSMSWTITAPRRQPAEGAAVDVLLHELESAKRLRAVEGRPTMGFESPRARGVIDVGSVAYRFTLGGDALVPPGAAYLQVDGEGAFVVDASLKEQLLRGADAYRDRTLVPYRASAMARIDIRPAAGQTWSLVRSGATLRLGPEGLRVSRAAADHLLSTLSDARAESFLDDGAADVATRPPAFAVTIVPRDGSDAPVELEVGGPCPGAPGTFAVARIAPSRASVCVAKGVVDALETTPLSPDASPFFAHADEMEEVRLEPVGGAGPTVDIARRGAGWHERAPQDRDLAPDESDDASALARALADALASSVRAAPADARFEPRSRVTIVRTGTSTSESVELAAPAPDGTVTARRTDDGAMLSLPREIARRFEPHPAALRGRAVWQPPFDAASVVGIDDTCGPTPQRLALLDHRWTLRAPAGLAADALTVADMTDVAAHLRADAWIAERDDGGFGFGSPAACSIRLQLAGATADAPGRTVSIALGAAGDGGIYARVQDDIAVFVAPAALRQAFWHPALDRSRFRLDPAALVRVTLVHGGERRVQSLDAGGDDRLASAVAALVPQAALHAGPPASGEGFERPTLELFVESRADGGAVLRAHIMIGAATDVDGSAAYFARVPGLEATFAVPDKAIAMLLGAP